MKFAIKFRNMNFRYESDEKNILWSDLENMELKFKHYVMTIKNSDIVTVCVNDGKSDYNGYIAKLEKTETIPSNSAIESGTFYHFLKNKK